jgi:glycosyltransferase involved in cell wall biosynthesis
MRVQMTETIVILTPAFPANESDSSWVPPVQLFVKKLKENFPALSVTVLSFNYPFHTHNYWWRNVQVTSFNGLHTRKLNRLMVWWKVWRRLKKIKREHNIIGLFSFWCGECALAGKYFGKRYGIMHHCWISGMDAKKENKLVKWIRPHADELIAMSPFLVNEFYKNHGVKPAHIIPNAIDPESFPSPVQERDIDILSAGTLIPAKQYDKLITVVQSLVKLYPPIKVVHCGHGSEELKLKAEVKKLGLEKNISFIGLKPHDEVLQFMCRSKLFLHPSAYEGFSTVCLEALYAGCEVISFCDPTGKPVPHWHIVNTTEEIVQKAAEILKFPFTEHTPFLLHSMDDSVKAVMKLFFTDRPDISQ